jgi:DNA-binding GntR family transcriptional regulator
VTETAPNPRRPVRPIERRTLADHAADHVRAMVFDGTLRPGDRVRTEAIAEALDVSPLPVREAMKVLGRDGLLELRPHRGAYVGPFDQAFLREHFEFVGMVQASSAVGTLRAADDDAMEELAALTDGAGRASSADEINELVMEFLAVMDRVGGSRAQHAVRDALGRLLPTGWFATLPGSADCNRRALARTLDALRSGDPDAVRTACLESQEERCDVIIGHLERTGVLEPPS